MQHDKQQHHNGRFLTALALGFLTLAWTSGVSAQVGNAQSPINIRSDRAIRVNADDLPSLRLRYQTDVTVAVSNTGSPDEEATVRANVPAGAGVVEVNDTRYALLQFHWHTPSEHQLDGEEFPMEMHLVHQDANGNLLVLGVLMEAVAGRPHQELAKIFAALPDTTGATTMVENVNLRRLLPRDRETFRYRGSLTTPPFAEGVRWFVMAEPIVVSPEQLAAFTALFPEGNSREVQPRNGRVILTDQEQAQ